MLWVDKYRPKTLAETDLHPEPTETLRRLGASEDIPHLLLYGPPGGGKRTRVMALLQEQFGPGVMNVKPDHKSVRVNESKTIEVTSLSSPYHIDVNPSDAGTYDRVVVMQMIREIASTAPVVTKAGGRPFKVVVLNEVDKLSRGAQQALRRTMEKYMATCRLILLCSSTSRLITPLRSRCLAIRIPLHDPSSIAKVARQIYSKEGLPTTPSDAFCQSLAVRSEGNLRRALLMLEACRMNGIDVAGSGGDIPLPDWKHYISEVASNVLAEQSPRMLHEVRGKFYELLAQCIPGEHIMRELLLALLSIAPSGSRPDIVAAAGVFDTNMKGGSKPIMHLEAFCAHCMAAIRKHKN